MDLKRFLRFIITGTSLTLLWSLLLAAMICGETTVHATPPPNSPAKYASCPTNTQDPTAISTAFTSHTSVSITHTTAEDFSIYTACAGLGIINQGDGTVRLQKILSIRSSDWVADSHRMPRGLSSSGAAIYEDFLYIAGGIDSRNFLDPLSAEVYYTTMSSSGELASWIALPSLPQKLAEHALVISGDYIYVLGGQTGLSKGSAVDTVYHARLNLDGHIQDGIWLTTSATLPHNLANFAAVAYRDQIYVIGGYHGSSTTDYHRAVYRSEIDPHSGQIISWVAQPEAYLPVGEECAEAAAIAYANTLYVIGGVRGSVARNQVFSATLTAEGAIVTTTNPVWTESSANLGNTLRQHAGVINSTRQVFLIGGRYGDGEQDNIYSALIDPHGQIITDWVTMLDALPEPRSDHATVLNDNNHLYVIGGIGSGGNSTDTVYHTNLDEIDGVFVPSGTLTGTFYLEGRPKITQLGIITTITDTAKAAISFQYCLADVPGSEQCEGWSTPAIYAPAGTGVETTSADINQHASYLHYRVVLTRAAGYEQESPYLEEVRLYYDKPTPDVYLELAEVLPPTHASAGEIVQYQIKYGNHTAGSVAHNAIITETLPNYTVYEGDSWHQVADTAFYTRAIPEIAFAEDYNPVIFRVRVLTQVAGAPEIVNRAQIQHDLLGLTEPDPDPDNNFITHALPLMWYNLQIVKVPYTAEVVPGAYLTYSIYITYSGNPIRPIDRLYLYEQLPANTRYAGPDSIIEGGWINTPTGSITYYRNLGAWDPATMGNSRRATFTVQVSPETTALVTNKVILAHYYSDAAIKEATPDDNEFVAEVAVSSTTHAAPALHSAGIWLLTSTLMVLLSYNARRKV